MVTLAMAQLGYSPAVRCDSLARQPVATDDGSGVDLELDQGPLHSSTARQQQSPWTAGKTERESNTHTTPHCSHTTL